MTERGAEGRHPWLGMGLALALAVLGLALAAAAAVLGRWDGLQALVPALVLLGGLSAGSLVLLLIHRLTGGQWGQDLRPPLLAAAGAVPVVGLLAAPLLVGLEHVYPWAMEVRGGAGAAAAHWYLNPPAFTARSLTILALWLMLAWSVGAYAPRSKPLPAVGASALYLLLMVVSMTLVGFDWVMSLDPEWYSAVFGLLVGVTQTLAAMALAGLWLGLHPPRAHARAPSGAAVRLSPDAGNLLLALLLLWGYLALMQLVTIWSANLPDEIRWFVPRLQTGWRVLGLAWLVLLPVLALPMLLSGRIKRRPSGLALAAGLVLFGLALYALWLTLPTARSDGPRVTLVDLTVLAGAGALWLAAYMSHLVLNRPATGVRRERAVVAWRPPALPASRGGVARTGTAAPAAAGSVGATSPSGAGSDGLEQEPSGIDAGTIVKVIAGIATVLIVGATVLLPWRHQESADPTPPEAGPALLSNPVANLADFRAAQHAALRDWGWVSREDGIAQVPVDRAIEMLTARGRSSTSPGEAGR